MTVVCPRLASVTNRVETQLMESGGGRDDPQRRAHMEKVWKVGMEISRSDIDRALLRSGLTRGDMEGLDRDIYAQIKVPRTDLLCMNECDMLINWLGWVGLGWVGLGWVGWVGWVVGLVGWLID